MAIGDRGKDLVRYLSVLRRWKWGIALIAVLATATALRVSSLQDPVYQSSARVLLGSNQSTLTATGFGQYIDPNSVQTEIQVLLGKAVRDLVVEHLGSAPPFAARAVGGTAVIELTARSSVAEAAARAANGYAAAYIEYRRQRFIDAVSAATQEYGHRIADLQQRITESETRPRPPGTADQELESLRAQQATFRFKLQELDAQEKLVANAASVIAPATVPTTSINPSPIRIGLTGLGVGLVLGVALALFLDHLDDSIKTKEDVESAAPALPVLGVIPMVSGWKDRAQPRLVSKTEPTSAAAEAYRSLRTSIQFMGLDRSLRIIQVTSAVAGEGKTTTLANLALTLSQAGSRVVVVSCDLRRPRIHQFFGLRTEVGFTSVLLGHSSITSALQPVPDVPRVMLLASGPLPPNPSELLSSRRTSDVLTQLRSQADIVLVDCPPLLPVTDAAVLANWVDGTLLVASSGKTRLKELARAVELLGQVDATMVGVVLNGGAPEGTYADSYKQFEARPITAPEKPSKVKRGNGIVYRDRRRAS